MSTTALAPAFLFAVVVILLACRLTGWLLRYLGQPPVVGEMVAGVLLGPSLLGLLAPGVESSLFPTQLRPVLYVAGQVGLVVFMFGAGYEFPLDRVRRLARPAAAISLSGVLVPLLLGIAAAWFARGHVSLRPSGVSFGVSAAFLGVTLAVTAFPMLARIITERGLSGTHFGSLSLACGALDDAIAWALLAGVLSVAAGSPTPMVKAAAGTVALVFALLIIARSRRAIDAIAARLAPEQLAFALVCLLFLAAWFTDEIGLYAVFGAFSLGVALPRLPAVDAAARSIRPVGTLFLPLFFTYSGLNTDFGLLAHPALLVFTAGCVVAAVLGKFGACWLSARLVGEPPAVALRVGTLMNARGLMQLIAINVGLAAGIVTHELFSVLVVVALVTTVMATPLLSWWDRRDARRGLPQPLPGPAASAEALRAQP